jgi:hypothetical protein
MTDEEKAAYKAGTLAYGKCYRCGHNFFDCGLRPAVDHRGPDMGPCEWCVRELMDEENGE